MRRWVKRGLWGLIALVIAAAVSVSVAYRPARKLIALVARDEERMLRSELRPPTQQRRVLVIAFDGVGAEQLERALSGGYLPTVAQYMGAAHSSDGIYPHAYAAPDVMSVLPSTTLAAWAATFTGKPPAENGITGNEWFERETKQLRAPAPVSLSSNTDTIRMLTDDLVGKSLTARTVFELADRKSFVSLNAIYRGADMFTAPGSHAMAGLLSDIRNLAAKEQGASREAYSEIDDESAEVVVENLRRKGIPDLQILYFPGVDLFTHVAENPQQDQLSYIRDTLDHSIAQVLNVYLAAGVLDDTTVLLVADHGHTDVLKDDRHALDTHEDDEPTRVLELAGFRVRPKDRSLEGHEQDFQAVVAYQGALAYVYLANRASCPQKRQSCDWRAAPRLEEDVLAVARAFHAANAADGPIPALRGTLDLIFAREASPVGQPAMPFQIFDGERLVPIAEYLASHPRPDLIDLEERMNGLGAGAYGHRAGDVVLLAKSRATDPIEERFYFSNKQYRSWHGSPSAQDSEIPLVLIRKSATGAALKAQLEAAVGTRPSQLSVTPLILSLLGGPEVRARSAPSR